jgi:predicted dehydrogenase
MPNAMLNIAVVGCGKIADDHLEQIRFIPGCRVIAACDREILMAQQLSDRFSIPSVFSDLSALLETCRPDVVHITTPPQSHLPAALQCLEAGCHLYVEKPFALTTADTRKMLSLAERKGLKVTVGHDLQFSPVARRLRQLVKDGYLGGLPVHMESYYCYDLSSPVYAKALLSNSAHWVRSLPGKLLQNIISHGIARIAEFLQTDHPSVTAVGFVSPLLRSLGEHEMIDELRVIISEQQSMTGYFTFSSQMAPALNLFRVFGPKNGLQLDQEQETLVRLRGARMKSYLEKFLPQFSLAGQYVRNSVGNMRLFAARQFQMKAGMRFLIGSFYESIATDGPPPIPYREIVLTALLMDSIFEQLSKSANRPLAGVASRENVSLIPAEA